MMIIWWWWRRWRDTYAVALSAPCVSLLHRRSNESDRELVRLLWDAAHSRCHYLSSSSQTSQLRRGTDPALSHHLRRKSLNYVVELILPCLIFCVVAIISHILQPACSDRLTLGQYSQYSKCSRKGSLNPPVTEWTHFHAIISITLWNSFWTELVSVMGRAQLVAMSSTGSDQKQQNIYTVGQKNCTTLFLQ